MVGTSTSLAGYSGRCHTGGGARTHVWRTRVKSEDPRKRGHCGKPETAGALRKFLACQQIRTQAPGTGGEGGIRTLPAPLQSITYRFLVATSPLAAPAAVAHCPKLPKCSPRACRRESGRGCQYPGMPLHQSESVGMPSGFADTIGRTLNSFGRLSKSPYPAVVIGSSLEFQAITEAIPGRTSIRCRFEGGTTAELPRILARFLQRRDRVEFLGAPAEILILRSGQRQLLHVEIGYVGLRLPPRLRQPVKTLFAVR